MSFTATFYNTLDDPRTVTKTLSQVKQLTAVIYKETTDRRTPQLILAYDADIEGANYVLINGYYYYITDYYYGQQRLVLQLKRDLLMTFNTEILAMNAIVKRQEKKFFTYLTDEKLPVEKRRLVTGREFDTGFSETDELILLVNGRM